jgi:hypothetical protein
VSPAGHGLLDVADAGAFVSRLARLDQAALVRLTSAAGGPDTEPRTALWGRLPWHVLVTRTVRGPGPGEATVAAADLLAGLAGGRAELPARRDADWRWPVPPDPGRAVERISGGELIRVGKAAAGALRTAVATRGVGERMVRDALLDHVVIVVTDGSSSGHADPARIEVPQRLVQAVLRMGFLGSSAANVDEQIQVRITGKWIGLAAPYGTAWLRPVKDFALRPLSSHLNG